MKLLSPTAEKAPKGHGWFPRGIHPPDFKAFSADCPVQILPEPFVLEIPLLQHAGAIAKLALKPGSAVQAGELLAEANGLISAPIHSSLAGKIGRPVKVTLPTAKRVDAITIQVEAGRSHTGALWKQLRDTDWDYSSRNRLTPQSILESIRNAGIVGLGGATFPTAVKLSPPPGKSIRRLLVNGCECEPFLTADSRLMEEAAGAVVMGSLLAARASGAHRVDIAVEDNKYPAVLALRAAAANTGVRVRMVPTKYPMGGEKQLIRAVYDRIVPTGGLPVDVGVGVINVSTATAIAMAVVHGAPLTHRVVSVTGPGVGRPGNFFVPIGMSCRELVEAAGGLKPNAKRVISGGPMMGFTLPSLDVPVTKGSSGIVVLMQAETSSHPDTACLRCGRCVDVCPLNLTPARFGQAVRHQRWELALRENIMACMECGCCAYQCPAGLPLVQLVRTGKSEIRKRGLKKGGR